MMRTRARNSRMSVEIAPQTRRGLLTMYRTHFALTQHPFGPEIAPEDLFPSTSSRELDIRLAHLLDLRGIGLITGDSGSGNTCACRKVLMQLHTGLYRVIYVSLSTGNVMDLSRPSPGRWASRSNARAQRSIARSKAKSRGCAPMRASGRSSS